MPFELPSDLIRPAGDGDAIAGVRPRWVATPPTTEQAAEVLRTAAAEGLAVVARGAGTKQDWALPPRRLDLVVDTSRLTGVVDHAAGDLVVVVRAGTPMSELAGKLAAAGQQLATDAPFPDATVGGTVAVNISGPRRMRYGTIRDLLIGITVVRPDGVVAHSGGRVVKNVAGYDLGKLMTGSYGTLGLITECAFRLHPIPTTETYLVRRGADPAVIAAVLGSQVMPSALEIDIPAGGEPELVVLLEGTPEGVAQRAASTAALIGGEVAAGPPDWFGRYPWRDGEIGVKLTAALSRVPALLSAAAEHGIPVRGCAGTGVLYANLSPAADPAHVLARLREVAEYAVVLTAPPPVRDQLDVWGPVNGLDLMRRVKAQFDPDSRFAPGRFVGGI
ncbi:MAG: FAD-binding oxidoreductase [Micromonosporaceae bacterium]